MLFTSIMNVKASNEIWKPAFRQCTHCVIKFQHAETQSHIENISRSWSCAVMYCRLMFKLSSILLYSLLHSWALNRLQQEGAQMQKHKNMHVSHICCIIDECTVNMQCMCWTCTSNTVSISLQKHTLPVFSLPLFTPCQCQCSTKFLFLNSAALWPFPFPLYSSLDSPLPHSSLSPPSFSFSLSFYSYQHSHPHFLRLI